MINEWGDEDLGKPLPKDREKRLSAIRTVESGGNPNAVSSAGATGPYQFMPGTAAQYGVTDPRNEQQARAGAGRYYNDLVNQFGGNEDHALMAYNWGPGNMQAYLKTGYGIKGQPMPEETRAYPGKVKKAEGRGTTMAVNEWGDQDVISEDTIKTKMQPPRKEPVFAEKQNRAYAPGEAERAAGETGREMQAKQGPAFIEASKGFASSPARAILSIDKILGIEPRKIVQEYAQYPETASGRLGAGAGDVAASFAVPARGVAGAIAQPLLGMALSPDNPMLGLSLGVGGQAAGHVVDAARKGAGWVTDKLRSITAPAAEKAGVILREKFGPDVADTVTALRNIRPAVPGEQPTAGLAATEGGSVLLKDLEEKARVREHTAEAFRKIDEANKAAIMNPLEVGAYPGIRYSGQPSEAEALRKQVTDPLFARANPQRVSLTPELEGKLAAAEARRAAAAGEASTEQAAANRPGSIGLRQPGVPGQMSPDIFVRQAGPGQQIYGPSKPFMPQQATRTIDDLQRQKNYLNEEIAALSGPNATPADELKAKQLRKVERDLDAAMRQSGAYGVASDIYGNYSEPITQAGVFRELAEKAQNAKGELTPGRFLEARTNEAKILRDAGEIRNNETLRQSMTPDQMQLINATTNALRRRATYENISRPQVGKIEAPTQQAEEAMIPWFSKVTTALRHVAKRAGAGETKAVQRVIDEATLHPERLVQLLETLPSNQRGLVMSYLEPIVGTTAKIASGALRRAGAGAETVEGTYNAP